MFQKRNSVLVWSTQGREEQEHNILVRKPHGRRLLRRHIPRRQDDIKIDIRDVCWIKCADVMV
jgi:hypothetical protein